MSAGERSIEPSAGRLHSKPRSFRPSAWTLPRRARPQSPELSEQIPRSGNTFSARPYLPGLTRLTRQSPVIPQGSTVVVEPATILRSASDVAVAFLLGYSERTRAAYRDDLGSWFAWCADHGVDPLQATRGHVDAYCRQLAEVDGCSPATIARRLSALSGFYRYALSEELVARNPVAQVRRPKVGTETISTGLDKDELTALLAAAEADGLRTHALVLACSG